jgi:hypothetical protein
VWIRNPYVLSCYCQGRTYDFAGGDPHFLVFSPLSPPPPPVWIWLRIRLRFSAGSGSASKQCGSTDLHSLTYLLHNHFSGGGCSNLEIQQLFFIYNDTRKTNNKCPVNKLLFFSFSSPLDFGFATLIKVELINPSPSCLDIFKFSSFY